MAITLYRIEGRPKLRWQFEAGKPDWVPIEEYSNPVTAETRMKYWEHQFPFKDLFNWQVKAYPFEPNKPTHSFDEDTKTGRTFKEVGGSL